MNNQAKITKLTAELARYNTSHLLHFIITMVTGVWVIVWILVADSNAAHRVRISNKISKLCDPNYVPESIPSRVGKILLITLMIFILIIILAEV